MFLTFTYYFSGCWILFSDADNKTFYSHENALHWIYFFSFTIMYISLKSTVGALCSLCVALLIAFIIGYAFKVYDQWKIKKKVDEVVIQWCELLILKMNSGCAFRTSLKESFNESEAFVQQNLILKDGFVSFKQQDSTYSFKNHFKDLINLLNECCSKEHLAFDLLKRFRKNHYLRKKLNNKKNIITKNCRNQAFLSIFIFSLLLIFSFYRYSWDQILTELIISVTFFVIGVNWSFRRGRRLIWMN